MPPYPSPRTGDTRPPLAVAGLAIVALALLALHGACLTQYGWFRDELYYLSCARRLDWGYVDQPPFSIAVLAVVRALFGESLVVLRLVAALSAVKLAIWTALLSRELGARTWGQVTVAAAVGLAPLSLALGHYYSMNVFDQVFWVLGAYTALRALRGDGRRWWLALGVVLGLGLLDKWSVAWLGSGIAVTLVVTDARRHLRTPWPWVAALVAAAIVSPHLAWESRMGWPTLEFMRNAAAHKMRALDLGGFLVNQVLVLGPGAAPLWVTGLVVSLLRRAWRLFAITWIVTLAILVANGSARVEYLALAAPALFAAGAAWWDARGPALRATVATAAVVLALPLVPMGLPILPVQRFIVYQKALGHDPATEERHRMGPLPQHQADMFGWPELADSVARVTATLAPLERARAIVIVDNYGEAGALDHFGAGRVPRIACQHNNWFYWPPAWDGSVAVIVGRDSAEVAGEFRSVAVAGVADHPLAMPYERHLPILVARGFVPDFRGAWVRGKHFQ
jgi:hypothetical protein